MGDADSAWLGVQIGQGQTPADLSNETEAGAVIALIKNKHVAYVLN